MWAANAVENSLVPSEAQFPPVVPVTQGDDSLNLVGHAATPAAAPVTGDEPEEPWTRLNAPAVNPQSGVS